MLTAKIRIPEAPSRVIFEVRLIIQFAVIFKSIAIASNWPSLVSKCCYWLALCK